VISLRIREGRVDRSSPFYCGGEKEKQEEGEVGKLYKPEAEGEPEA